MPDMIKGTALPYALQQEARRKYGHRFTGDNKPAWARGEWKDGKPYPLQFANDADWLENTLFPVTKRGALSNRPSDCRSSPTWPNNPELRN